MTKKIEAPITFAQGLNDYFGGIVKMNRSALPWKCKCGYSAWHLEDCKSHIKNVHKETFVRSAEAYAS